MKLLHSTRLLIILSLIITNHARSMENTRKCDRPYNIIVDLSDCQLDDPNVQLSWTPIHDAAYKGEEQILEQHTKNITSEEVKKLLNKPELFGQTPLWWAASSGERSTTLFLINHGADIHSADKWKRTPLHVAADHANIEIINLLVANGAEIESQDCYGNTPLHTLSIKNNTVNNHCTHNLYLKRVTCAKFLLQKGANLLAKNKNGQTPLHYAETSSFGSLVRVYKEHMAQNNSQQ